MAKKEFQAESKKLKNENARNIEVPCVFVIDIMPLH